MILMKGMDSQNAIFEGEKLSVSLSVSLIVSLSVSHADPQSTKQTNAILVNERKKWTAKIKNTIFEGEKLSVSLSASQSV